MTSKLPEHQCPECLAALNGFREWPQTPRRSFFRAQCDICGWTGPKTMSSSSVEYSTPERCPFCNFKASGPTELREHISADHLPILVEDHSLRSPSEPQANVREAALKAATDCAGLFTADSTKGAGEQILEARDMILEAFAGFAPTGGEAVAWRAWQKADPSGRRKWPSEQWVYWDEEPTTIQDDPEYSQFQALYAHPAQPPAQVDAAVEVMRAVRTLRQDVRPYMRHLEDCELVRFRQGYYSPSETKCPPCSCGLERVLWDIPAQNETGKTT